MKVVAIDPNKVTLISVQDYYREGNALCIPSGSKTFHFSSFEELETFRDNNPKLELEDSYIIPQIAKNEVPTDEHSTDYSGIEYIIYADEEITLNATEINHRLAMIVDEVKELKSDNNFVGTNEVMLTNILVACDLESDECMSWKPYGSSSKK
jgi:hypothetical protein